MKRGLILAAFVVAILLTSSIAFVSASAGLAPTGQATPSITWESPGGKLPVFKSDDGGAVDLSNKKGVVMLLRKSDDVKDTPIAPAPEQTVVEAESAPKKTGFSELWSSLLSLLHLQKQNVAAPIIVSDTAGLSRPDLNPTGTGSEQDVEATVVVASTAGLSRPDLNPTGTGSEQDVAAPETGIVVLGRGFINWLSNLKPTA